MEQNDDGDGDILTDEKKNNYKSLNDQLKELKV